MNRKCPASASTTAIFPNGVEASKCTRYAKSNVERIQRAFFAKLRQKQGVYA